MNRGVSRPGDGATRSRDRALRADASQ
jgi:hypothetical protein